MKKVLIFGGTGFIGREIGAVLEKKRQRTVISPSRLLGASDFFALERKESWDRVLERERPDEVISCLRGDFSLQREFHRFLVKWGKENQKILWYLSTANVFDGDFSRAHGEMDTPCPVTEYGTFKAEMEELIIEEMGNSVGILRLPMVWGENSPRVRQLLDCKKEGKQLEIPRDFYLNTTTARRVAEDLSLLLEREERGIFHSGAEDVISYEEFLKILCHKLSVPVETLRYEEENPDETLKRKLFQLKGDRLRSIAGYEPYGNMKVLEETVLGE